MPELPEVETVCRGLAGVLAGQKITDIETRRKNLRIPFPAHLSKVKGAHIQKISRRAKYILIRLDNGQTLIMHLGMSGSLVIQDQQTDRPVQKHDHMIMTFGKEIRVVFNDPRRFGMVDLADTAKLATHRFFRHLGPEPFAKEFSADYLAQKLKGRSVAIKLAIMDQKIVVGVGNIYASEALFMAGIDPHRQSKTLGRKEIKKLVTSIQKVLMRAIKAGGSSLRNYVQADGELGYFQHQWAVYGKAGQKCKACHCNIKKTGGVQRLIQGGRATFYCSEKQK